MKEKEARFNTERKLILYVEKDNGSFSPIETGSYMIENYFHDFLEKRKHLQESCSEKLKKGEINPIEYYRILINIGVSDLASRVGISPRKVRKHLITENFKKIDLDLLKRYAEVFRVPLANLFQLFENKFPQVKINQKKTPNPWLVETIIEEVKSE